MKKFKRIMAALCALVMAVALCVPSVPVYAEKDSDAIENAKSGVVLIELVYIDAAGTEHPIQSGTGFLIDESYVITCYHVVHMTDEMKVKATDKIGVDFVNSEPSGLQVHLIVRGDATINLTETSANSEIADFSVLKLEESINNRTYLPLGDSTLLNSSDNVYALGFPSISSEFQDAQFYSSDEVNVESGTVTKIAEENNLKYVQHSATLSGGSSGGPLLDDAGEVVGIDMAVIVEEDSNGLTTYTYRAIGISEVRKYLDDYGIPYIDGASTTSTSSEAEVTSEADDTDSEPESQAAATDTIDKSDLTEVISQAENVDESKYTADSYSAVKDALSNAQSVYNSDSATQSEIDAAKSELQDAIKDLEETSDFPVLIVVIIAVVVVVIIIIIIIIAVSSSKKKKKKLEQQRQQQRPQPQGPGPRPQQPPYGQPQPAPQPQYQAPPQPQPRPYTPPMPEGAGETTVLNSGAGETTVLGGQPSAMLRRVKTGEAISINKQTFTIGKERRRVDYCISDNTSISRAHAQIICKGGEYFVVDQGSTNFTFVNGNKIPAHQEVKLNSGDKVKLSDEEFEFRI